MRRGGRPVHACFGPCGPFLHEIVGQLGALATKVGDFFGPRAVSPGRSGPPPAPPGPTRARAGFGRSREGESGTDTAPHRMRFTYGFRPGRGAHQALEALWRGLTDLGGGWVIDLDIEDFFWQRGSGTSFRAAPGPGRTCAPRSATGRSPPPRTRVVGRVPAPAPESGLRRPSARSDVADARVRADAGRGPTPDVSKGPRHPEIRAIPRRPESRSDQAPSHALDPSHSTSQAETAK